MTTTLTLEKALPVIDAAGQAGVPVLLRGGSGIGKSSGLATLAAARGEHLEVVTASLHDPTDFGGIPHFADGELRLAALPWLKRVLAAGRPARVVFDEINTAPPPTQAALLRVLLEGVSGDTRLPDGTVFVAAMNPVAGSAGGWELTAPIANRFLHLDVSVDADEWVAGMLSGWSLTPDTVTCLDPAPGAVADATAAVTAFILEHRELLHDQPTDPAAAARAWPSPRTWDWVTRILPRVPDAHDLPVVAVEGLVGKVAADQFFTYREQLELPAAADVLADPAGVAWGTEPAERVAAILSAVTSTVADGPSYTAAGKVLSAAVAAGRSDVAASVVRPYLARTPDGVARDKQLLASFAPLLVRAGKIG